MCGINGFNWRDEQLIEAMNHATRLRGPDDEGVFLGDHVSLGHSRLSIIDLSANASQPMPNEDRRIWLTFNGEIYNFQTLRAELRSAGHDFCSRTDSEVIIHAYEQYGLDCLNRFNGMWAFCLYDAGKRRLILSRDRFGVKPLYYYLDAQRLIFSSMITAILAHDIERQPNEGAIMEYLAFNLEHHGAETFFAGIQSLLPGHLLIYDLATRIHHIRRWYSPQVRSAPDPQELRRLFDDSVARRTVSDVPIGCCLSGGVDSTAIVCTLRNLLAQPFNTYSLVAPGSPFDERRYIDAVVRHTGVRPFFTALDEGEFLDDLTDFMTAHEEPLTTLSPYAEYRLMKLAHQQGARVLLGGQGADELFAGYIYHFGYYFYELFARLHWPRLTSEMIRFAWNFRSFFPHQLALFLLMPDSFKSLAWRGRLNAWLNHDFLNSVCPGSYDPRWQAMTLQQARRLTVFSTSIPHNVRWEDKNSMRWSIETRAPFLDYELVEAALSLPADQLLHRGRSKVALREAVSDVLPPQVRDRKDKIGYRVPVDDFFRSPRISAFFRTVMESDSFRRRPFWHWAKVKALFEQHVAGRRNIGDTVWKWINVELWLRLFFDGVGRAPDAAASRQTSRCSRGVHQTDAGSTVRARPSRVHSEDRERTVRIGP